MKKLLEVGDVFEAPGRGLILVGRAEAREAQLSSGTVFDLVLPTGVRHTLTALGVERFTGCFTEVPTFGILIGDQLDTLQGLVGAGIWVDQQDLS
jgi:hypothetical protein